MSFCMGNMFSIEAWLKDRPRHRYCTITDENWKYPELGECKQRLEQERQTITERIEQIQRQEKQQSIKAQIIDEFSAFCASAQKALENPTPETKQEVLRLSVESIVIEDDAITIKHIIPTDDGCLLLPRGNKDENLRQGLVKSQRT